MLRLRRRVGVLALAAGIGLAMVGPSGAQEYGPDLETYRNIIEEYRAGHSEGPVGHMGGWGPIWVESTVDRLLRWCRKAPREPGRASEAQLYVRTALGAFLLHAHVALASHSLSLPMTDHDAHLDAAWRLLRWTRDMWEDAPGSWPPEARGLRPRHFYLALASGELLLGRQGNAKELARESLGLERRDAAMRLLAGCAWEFEAAVRRVEQRSGAEWDDHLLQKAERRFREALEDDPSLLEARLRLGWVLVRRGETKEARAHLTSVAEKSGDSGRRALAWLFLSAAHEKSGDVTARVEACRRATRLAPHMQAAHVCLAHALEEEAGDEASRAVLGSLFRERGRSWTLRDPWSDYAYGPPELRQHPFEALVRRLTTP